MLFIARVVKNIWRIISTIGSIWRENMLGYLSLDILSVPQSSQFSSSYVIRSQKTARFWEQIMSADKYPSIYIFAPNGGYCIVYIYQPAFALFRNLKPEGTPAVNIATRKFKSSSMFDHEMYRTCYGHFLFCLSKLNQSIRPKRRKMMGFQHITHNFNVGKIWNKAL